MKFFYTNLLSVQLVKIRKNLARSHLVEKKSLKRHAPLNFSKNGKYKFSVETTHQAMHEIYNVLGDNRRGYFTSCVAFKFRATPQGREKKRVMSKMSALIID